MQLLLENFEDHCSGLRNITFGHMPENLPVDIALIGFLM